MLRRPVSLAPHFVAFAWRYPAACPWLRSQRPRHETAGLGFLSGPHIPDAIAGRQAGPPRFLENPCVPTPCSPTPVGPIRQAIRRTDSAPALATTKAHHDDHYFGAQSHGLGTRCLRFVRYITARDARLASRCWPALRDGIGYPQDSNERFRVAPYISSPFPRLAWRNAKKCPFT